MDLIKEGGSTSRLSLLDGTNFGFWKARMHAFIKSINDLAWRSVLQGQKPPTKIDAKGKIVPKSETSEHLKKKPYPPKTHVP